jgi:hypothetical protein
MEIQSSVSSRRTDGREMSQNVKSKETRQKCGLFLKIID